MLELTPAQVRRAAVAAQGLAARRPGAAGARVDRRAFRRVLETVGAVQIDSVNVISRAHELTFFARLGPYDRTALARWLHDSGEVFEYWGHAACFFPALLHPVLRWKMAAYAAGPPRRKLGRNDAAYLDEIRQRIDADGPITPADLHVGDGPRRTGPWWGWDAPKIALERLFSYGEITAVRGNQFQRFYDRFDRVLPAEVLEAPTPSEEEGRRALLLRAARAMGVATAKDLAQYDYQLAKKARPIVAAMAADGELVRVEVPGWKDPAFLHPEAALPRRVRARALLAPFDSLTWERDRIERVFDFRYRIEIYTPAPKRVYGYYVLPFLLDDRLVGRVDLKADRAGGALLVRGAYAEDGVDHDHVASELAAELVLMAGWLGLDDVVVSDRGDLAPAVALALR
jgi:uncharacterized protein YcaQ